MSGRSRRGWRDSLTAVATALVEVVRTELAQLGEDWKQSLTQVSKAVGALLIAGVAVLLTLPPLLAVALLHGLTYWLPLWGAALVTAAVVLLVAAIPATLGYVWLRRWQTPVAQARQRVGEHVDWWQGRILEPPTASNGGNLEGDTERGNGRQADSAGE